MTIKNAKTLPKIYYGLHMVEGVAEYKEPEQKPYRILIGEEAIKNMDPTFSGKPVYVLHVDEVNLPDLQVEADGYVTESFFNQADGKHWAKFIIVSDAGHEAIKKGWKLSNSYFPKKFSGGGLWHGVEYLKEVTEGEYEHLALVPNPRYEESIILTVEEFKLYNGEKELELKRLANAKETNSMAPKFNFFKRTKVENSIDMEEMIVVLPKCQKELSLTQVINALDEHEEKAKANMADPKHMVKIHDGSMCNVAELVEKHKALHDAHEELKKKLDSKEGEEDLELEETGVDVEGDKHNEDESDDERVRKEALDIAKSEEAEIAAKKKNAADKVVADKKKNFSTLKNAHLNASDDDGEPSVMLVEDKIARGKECFGSGK